MKVSITEFATIKELVFSRKRKIDRFDKWDYILKVELGLRGFYYSFNYYNVHYPELAKYYSPSDFKLEEFSVLHDDPNEVKRILEKNRYMLFTDMYYALEREDNWRFNWLLNKYEETLNIEGAVRCRDYNFTVKTLKTLQNLYDKLDDDSVEFQSLKQCYDIVIKDLTREDKRFYID